MVLSLCLATETKCVRQLYLPSPVLTGTMKLSEMKTHILWNWTHTMVNYLNNYRSPPMTSNLSKLLLTLTCFLSSMNWRTSSAPSVWCPWLLTVQSKRLEISRKKGPMTIFNNKWTDQALSMNPCYQWFCEESRFIRNEMNIMLEENSFVMFTAIFNSRSDVPSLGANECWRMMIFRRYQSLFKDECVTRGGNTILLSYIDVVKWRNSLITG